MSETTLQASIAFARMKLRDAWEAHQRGPVVPCGEAFERAHEAQTAILDAIEALAAAIPAPTSPGPGIAPDDRDLLLNALCGKRVERMRDPVHHEMGLRVGKTFYPLETLASPMSDELRAALRKAVSP